MTSDEQEQASPSVGYQLSPASGPWFVGTGHSRSGTSVRRDLQRHDLEGAQLDAPALRSQAA